MIKEDLVAERVAIDSYSELIRYLGDNDVEIRWTSGGEGVHRALEDHLETLRPDVPYLHSDVVTDNDPMQWPVDREGGNRCVTSA